MSVNVFSTKVLIGGRLAPRVELATLYSADQRYTNTFHLPWLVLFGLRQKGTQKITLRQLVFTYGNCKSVYLDWLFTHISWLYLPASYLPFQYPKGTLVERRKEKNKYINIYKIPVVSTPLLFLLSLIFGHNLERLLIQDLNKFSPRI